MDVRISADGLAQAKALASSLDLSLSGLVRLLLQCARPGSLNEPESHIVVDRDTAVRLRREMRRWGHHYNQAVHALNAIAYYLRLNEMDACEVKEELEKANRKLESMNSGVIALQTEVDEISAHPLVYT